MDNETVVEDNSNISRPTATPNGANIGPAVTRLFGRKIIYADYLPDEMNEKTISKILNDVFSVHLQNANEIDYLQKYYLLIF